MLNLLGIEIIENFVQYIWKSQMYKHSEETLGFHPHSKEASTGFDFAHFVQSRPESDITFEIESQREYVNRLKIQREKIQTLYQKYDTLLHELQNKQILITEQGRTIDHLQQKIRDHEFLTTESESFQRDNCEMKKKNEELKNQLRSREISYRQAFGDLELYRKNTEMEKQSIEDLNKSLMTKIIIIQKKLQENETNLDKERKAFTLKLNEMKKQIQNQKSKNEKQITSLNIDLFKAAEEIDILQNQVRRLNDTLIDEKQLRQRLIHEQRDKVDKMNNEHKIKVKTFKHEIQQLNYTNQHYAHKIKELNAKIQSITQENQSLQNILGEQKRTNEEKLYKLKYEGCQDKTLFREKKAQLEWKITSLEKQLEQRNRQQRELMICLKNYEQKQKMKQSFREVQKNELERINRLLLFEK